MADGGKKGRCVCVCAARRKYRCGAGDERQHAAVCVFCRPAVARRGGACAGPQTNPPCTHARASTRYGARGCQRGSMSGTRTCVHTGSARGAPARRRAATSSHARLRAAFLISPWEEEEAEEWGGGGGDTHTFVQDGRQHRGGLGVGRHGHLLDELREVGALLRRHLARVYDGFDHGRACASWGACGHVGHVTPHVAASRASDASVSRPHRASILSVHHQHLHVGWRLI